MKKKLFFNGLVMTVIVTIVITVNNRHRPGPYAALGWTYRTEGNMIIIESTNYREYGNDEYARLRKLIDGVYDEAPNSAPEPLCQIMVTMPQPPSVSYRYMRKEFAPDPFLNCEAF